MKNFAKISKENRISKIILNNEFLVKPQIITLSIELVSYVMWCRHFSVSLILFYLKHYNKTWSVKFEVVISILNANS